MASESVPKQKPMTTPADEIISGLALQIVREASRPEVSVSSLSDLAERDAGFAARLLSIVNSPVHGFSRKVTSIRQAAALVGVTTMRNIALGLSITDLVPVGDAGEALIAIGLRRAVAAQRIAEALRLPQPNEFFTAGILLEVGVLAHARLNLREAADIATSPAASRPTRERAVGGRPHPERGAELARKWYLPTELVEAISRHHDPKPPDAPISKVAWAAEHAAAVFEGGNTEQLRTHALMALTRIGLPRPEAELVLSELPERVRVAASAFLRSVGTQQELDKVLLDANARLREMNQQYEGLIRSMEAVLAQKQDLVLQLEQANTELARVAATDGLTDLLNRRAFFDAVGRDLARARRSGEPIALVLFDVDHFKTVNDTHGHQVGDQVLREISKSTLSTLRKGDIVGRYGGEEFSVLLNPAPFREALMVADRIRAAIAATPISSAKGTFYATASFGVSAFRPDDTIETLVARADTALYASKGAGRNCVSAEPT